MHVELNEADCGVRSRNVSGQNGPRTVYEQTAYLWQHGVAYPLPFRLEVNSPSESYPAGTYIFGPGSVRTNQFGALEFNRFDMRLLSAKPRDAASKAS